MKIRERIDERLKQARRERDEPTKNVIGMLKNKVLMAVKASPDVEETDALWLQSITAYAKQLGKSLAEFEKVGDRASELKAEAEFELAFCEAFLPRKLDEARTEALVRELAATHSLSGAKSMGKLMGLVMKDHRDEVDGELVRAIAARVLGEG